MAISPNSSVGGDPHGWLETDAMRRISDIALGAILLIVGVFFLWYPVDNVSESWEPAGVGPKSFPTYVAGSLCAVAIFLLIRAALRRSPPVRNYSPLHVVIAVAVILVFAHAIQLVGASLFLRFGPPELLALMILVLAIAIALAQSSHARATGLLLLGLLLATVGVDTVTGTLRFTMGEVLMAGIDPAIVLVGLFLVGDALVCLVSPLLLLRTYTRLITDWRIPQIPVYASLAMRLVAGAALLGACFFAYALLRMYLDIVWIFIFGILGVAGKIFGWNRYLLYIGVTVGTILEISIRQTLMGANGDYWVLLNSITGTLLGATIIVLGVAMTLSIRRAVARK